LSFAEDYIEQEPEPVSEVTRRRLEMMISVALLNPNERLRYEEKSVFISEQDALKMCEELKPFMPIMGLHRWPHGQNEELGLAIKYQVDKDDLHEQRWKR
jgi:hypothetical protein